MRSILTSLLLAAFLALLISPLINAQGEQQTNLTDAGDDDGVVSIVSGIITELTDEISECQSEPSSACASNYNRTCYNYVESGTHECGYCLLGFIEFQDECYSIEEIEMGGFVLLDRIIQLFLPEYADETVTTAQRVIRLVATANIISFWNSQIPPMAFSLGLSNETLLTVEEREGRRGIIPGIIYDQDAEDGRRGKMDRFEFNYGASDDTYEEGVDGGERKLQDSQPNVDWEAEGYTTHIKNQGVCGCCWAVSVAAAVESALMITNQTDRYDEEDDNSLSFQQLVSCDDKENGCAGGNIFHATRYVWENDNFNNGGFGGIVAESDWPYSDFLGDTTTECKIPTGVEPVAYLNYPQIVNTVKDRSSFEERRERLLAAVTKQPVTAVLKSSCDLLSSYRGGVLTHDTG